jgi:hypothetical protein
MDFLKNLKLVINKLHVRFEDDYLTGAQQPYSIGLVVNVLIHHSLTKRL